MTTIPSPNKNGNITLGIFVRCVPTYINNPPTNNI